jgi:hypothetical protein
MGSCDALQDTAMANGLTVGVIAFFLVFCGFLVNTGVWQHVCMARGRTR